METTFNTETGRLNRIKLIKMYAGYINECMENPTKDSIELAREHAINLLDMIEQYRKYS